MNREPSNTVRLEFTSRPENVGFARTAVAVFASQLEFTLDEIDEIKVAVSEAVSNAIIHGYREREGMVRIEVALYEQGISVMVADDGPGIADVAWAMQPGRTTEQDRMGLGLVFIKEYTDELRIETGPASGTRLYMTKRLTRELEQ